MSTHPEDAKNVSRRQLVLALGGLAAGVAVPGVGLGNASADTKAAALRVGTNRPFILHFDWSTPPSTSYGAGCMVVLNWWGSRHFPDEVQQIRRQDAEVLEYTVPVHDYSWDDGTNSGIPEIVRFFTGGSGDVYRRSDIPRQWYWDPVDPGRVRVPNYDGHVMDLRPNSAWFNHLLTSYYPWRLDDPNWKLDGFQLDVLGDGYLGWVDGASQAELDLMAEGMRWFMTALRRVVGNQCILFNNNFWLSNNDATNGIMIENHDGSEIGNEFWVNALARVQRRQRRRNITTSSNADAACAWAQVRGVDHAGYWSDGYDIGPEVPFGTCSLGNHGWPPQAGHIHLWDSTRRRSDRVPRRLGE
ncbi:hypothetical protein BH24ACT9_BH24ACT9_14400 [soil metagenome]